MNKNSKIFKKIFLSISILIFSSSLSQYAGAAHHGAHGHNAEPLKVLMITGGGPYHDYYTQLRQLTEGLTDRIGNIEFTIDHDEGANKQDMYFKFESLQTDEWTQNFDLVLYNSCNLHVAEGNPEYVDKIIQAHVKSQIPAVMTHCPMHLHRTNAPNWYNFTGAESYVHEVVNTPFTIELLEPNNPIMVNFPDTWRTPNGELYMPVELKDNATPLARAYGAEPAEFFPIAWTHEYEGVRVFSSTLGHHNVTMGSDVNLNLVAAGLLWAAGKLSDDGSPSKGYSGERGLGWISLLKGGTLHGWRATQTTDWSSFSWWDGKDIWPSKENMGTDSFKLVAGKAEHLLRMPKHDAPDPDVYLNTILVEGPQSNLFYVGPIDGGDFKNFEFKVDVYTSPGSASGIYFHTRYKNDGRPVYGYEAQINASRRGESKTGSLVGVSEVKTTSHTDNEWFSYYIKVDGKKVTIKVNGETVNEFTEPDDAEGPASLRRGTIAMESISSKNSRVQFRNPMIRPLPDNN